MAKEEKVTPEEKLLKVIQGDKKPAPASASPAKASTTQPEGPALATVGAAAVASQEGAASEEADLAAMAKSKLKLVKSDAKPEAAAAAADGGAGGRAAAQAPAAKRAVFALGAGGSGRGAGAAFGLREFNRVLAAVIVLFLLFAVWDIWGMVSRGGDIAGTTGLSGGTAPAAGDGTASPPDDGGGQAPVSKYLAAFEKRPIVENSDKAAVKPGGTDVVVKPPEQAVLKLKGLSATGETGTEAIIEDARTRKLYFVKAGDKFVAGDFEFEVVQIDAEKVTVAKGSEQIVLK